MKMLGCIYVVSTWTWTLNGMSRRRTAATDAKATQGQRCFGRAFGSLRLVLEVWLRKWRDRLISIIHNYRYYIDMEVESYSYRFILSFIITYSYHSSYILSPIILRPGRYSLIIIHIHTRYTWRRSESSIANGIQWDNVHTIIQNVKTLSRNWFIIQ